MSRISYLSELFSSVFARQEQQSSIAEQGTFLELCDALLSQSGEISGNRLSRGLLNRFAAASADEKLDFFKLLAERFDINAEHAIRAAQHYAAQKQAKNLAILQSSVEPRRQELFRRLNRVPGATNELVQMRAELLTLCKEHPELSSIDVDLQHLFRAWFNRGFLVLRQIDWHTPANILEKIIAYEAVHAIDSWESLRTRLQPEDRLCFAFFHPAMLDEPLIFVEVALTQEIPDSIHDILSADRQIVQQDKANMAVFYSISNCQKGLAGVTFGNFLIKQVARELAMQFPGLKTYRTLSPVPGFMRWVNQLSDGAGQQLDTQHSESLLHEGVRLAKRLSEAQQPEMSKQENELMQSMVAHYIAEQKRTDHLPLDPVARFHLGNGASLSSVLPGADQSKKGLDQSAGSMVSYLYAMSDIETNHEAFANEQRVMLSTEVEAMLTRLKKAKKRA